MRKFLPLASLLAVLAILAACASTPRYAMEGDYDASLQVTDSNHPNFPVGFTEDAEVNVTTTDDEVTFETGSFSLTGTRSGNEVLLTGLAGDEEAAFDLRWTSDETFEGTGRIDYPNDQFVEFDIEGEEAISITALPRMESPAILR